MQIFKKLSFLLTRHEKNSAIFLLFLTIIMALLDAIGVASILPFITVLTDPSVIQTNSALNKMFLTSKVFGIENDKQFLFSLGILVFVVLVVSLIFKSLMVYMQARFIQMREYSIAKLVVERYLHQPYSWFLNRHSAEIGKTVLSEVNRIVGNALVPLMDIITKTLVVIALTVLLIIVDPKLAFIVILVLGGAYSVILYFLKTSLLKIGEQSLKLNELRFLALSEAFRAVKEIKIGGLEEYYIKQFSIPANSLAKNEATVQVISQLPRFILEIVAFGGILLIILFMMYQTNNFNNSLPIISLYVFAGYRLMPAVQGIYTSFTNLAFIGSSLDLLFNDLKSLKPINKNPKQSFLSFNESITLKNIYYNYPNASRTTLKDINLIIPAKSTVGFMGPTGSGKTTLIDILLGLLEPQKGTLEIDGEIIKKNNLRSWQQFIGYVPQHIYISDDTIAANIAFGLQPKNIDMKKIEKVAKEANLHDFVINELPRDYQTKVGENGARLSGGQRQRIGIARALYNSPKVIIMDEATSALDYQTEEVIMDSIKNLSKNSTIILVAHRLNTLKCCDVIFKLEKGKIENQGSFESLKL